MDSDTQSQLREVLRAVFELGPDFDVTTLAQASHEGWDSLAHTVLMGALESEFAVVVEVGDALDLTSYDAIARFIERHGR